MTLEKVALGTVAKVLNGYAFKSKEYVDDGIRIVRITNVQKGRIQDDDPKFIDIHRSDEFAHFMLHDGDILISLTGNVGRVGVIEKPMLPAALNQRVGALKVESESIEPEYLFHVLNSENFEQAAIKNSKGIAQLNLSSKWIEKYEIPLPPLAEQKRIAGILDAADALRARRRESLAQLDTLLQSTFLEMFGDPVTNPMGWEERRIDTVFEVARGGSPRPIQAYLTDSEDGLNWIMIGDASEDSRYISSTKKRIKPEGLKKSRMVHEGDFLLTNSMSFGKPYILKTDGCIHDGWLVLSPKEKRMPADFFYSLLSTDALYREFSRRAAGAVVKNLNIRLVKQVPIPLPPLEFQQRFAAIVESVEQQKAAQRAHLMELDTLFAALQQRAFGGEL